MLSNQVEYPLVLGTGPQPSRDRHSRRRRHQLHPTPLPQPCRPHSHTIAPTTDKPDHDQHRPKNQPATRLDVVRR
jgi:hypothetical protein